MADPRNFILDSDYPMDKIVFIGEYTVEPTALDNFLIVDHNLGTMPLTIGIASSDNWQTTISLPSSDPYVSVFSDNTKLLIANVSDTTYSVKVFGLTVESDDSDFSATSNLAQKYLLNSEYDYLKLAMSGQFRLGYDGTYTITHNLGYIPTTLIWRELDQGQYGVMCGQTSGAGYLIGSHPAPTPIFDSNKYGLMSNTTSVTIYGTPNDKYYYRIYGDAS